MSRVYGWRPDKPDIRDRKYTASRGVLVDLPAVVDLTVDCPIVYDQGVLGSCTANAIGAAFQFEQIKQERKMSDPGRDFIPSRLFIYYNERVIEGSVDIDAGAEIRDGIKTVVKQGVCPETVWPYDVARFREKPVDACYQDALNHQVVEYLRVDQTLDQLKACLAAGYPVVFGFTVYESFEGAEVARTGLVTMPHGGERVVGGHAVMAVGYDDATQRFLVRNSWGEGWGKNGYFTMPYEYLLHSDLAADFWTIRLVEVPVDHVEPGPAPTPGPTPNPGPGKQKGMAPSLDCTYWKLWTQFIEAVNSDLENAHPLEHAIKTGLMRIGVKTQSINMALNRKENG